MFRAIGRRLGFASIVVAALGSSTLAQTSPGVDETSITIGGWQPLSGPLAEYGVNLRAGAEAYFNLINDQGGVNGRKIKWIVEDNAYSAQQTVAIARKLVTRDNVFAMVNVHGTGPTAATFPFVRDQMHVPFAPAYAGAKEWYDPPKTDLLGVYMLYFDQLVPVGRWAASDGHKKIVFVQGIGKVYDEEGDGAEHGARSVIPGVEFHRIALKFGTADYASVAQQIKEIGPDAIISVQVPQELTALKRELKRISFDPPMYTFQANVLQSLIDLAGQDIEGLKGVSLLNSPFDRAPALQEYRDAMQKYSPDLKPDFVSLLSFAMAKIFVEAVRNAKEPLTRESLVASYLSMKDYDTGILPPVSFSAERTLGATKARRMQVIDGRWVVAGEWEETR